ncbi:MAG: type IV pilin N-terminal domain-containing protein [Nitrosopumilus sp.]|nr:type IV pilin N-terminal domain-containing protein [Nitrosopumilus sp.]
MTKLHTKNRKMASRRAVAPVIATLLLVAIAVVGGSIIFVFSQGFFSQAQVSGSPQIESVEIIGYDASDTLRLTLHDGIFSTNATTPFDQASSTDGIAIGDRIGIYVQNQSAQAITLQEISVAGVVYNYPTTAPTATLGAYTATPPAQGEFIIITNGVVGTTGVVKTNAAPILEAGEEATILVNLDRGMSDGRDAQFKIETGTGSIFVGTIIAGQQSG